MGGGAENKNVPNHTFPSQDSLLRTVNEFLYGFNFSKQSEIEKSNLKICNVSGDFFIGPGRIKRSEEENARAWGRLYSEGKYWSLLERERKQKPSRPMEKLLCGYANQA